MKRLTERSEYRFKSEKVISLALSLSSQMIVAAHAAESITLKTEMPALDLSPIQNSTKQTTTLNGSIQRAKKIDSDEGGELNLTGGSTSAPYALALKKLSAGLDLSRDEYRSLGIGVLGYENVRPFYTREANIVAVFPGCPIALSGIEVGDVELEQHVDDSKVADPTRPLWMFTCGVEGEALDLKIRHHGHVSMHHVVRMNMEDIPDEKQRLLYEQLVKKMAVGEHSVEMPKPSNVSSDDGD